jgi:hypothetical protein
MLHLMKSSASATFTNLNIVVITCRVIRHTSMGLMLGIEVKETGEV